MEIEYLNRVELRGRIGSPIRISNVGDSKVARFSLATVFAFQAKNGDMRQETTWHFVTAWSGKNMIDFGELEKGALVHIEGRIRNIYYTDVEGIERNMTEVLAAKIDLLEALQ